MTVDLLSSTWQHKRHGEDLELREFVFQSESYTTKYDEIQKTIVELSGIDDLLAGRPYTICTICKHLQAIMHSMYNMIA